MHIVVILTGKPVEDLVADDLKTLLHVFSQSPKRWCFINYVCILRKNMQTAGARTLAAALLFNT